MGKIEIKKYNLYFKEKINLIEENTKISFFPSCELKFVILLNKKIIGFLCCEINKKDCFRNKKKVFHILSISLDTFYQQKGYAPSILNFAKFKAIELDCDLIEIEVHINNKNALNFNRKFGFKTVAIDDEFENQGLKCCVQHLDLN